MKGGAIAVIVPTALQGARVWKGMTFAAPAVTADSSSGGGRVLELVALKPSLLARCAAAWHTYTQ